MSRSISLLKLIIAIFFLSSILSCDKNFDVLKIVSSTPANGATGIEEDFTVEIEFSQEVNRTDVEDNFTVTGTVRVAGNFEWLTGKRFRYVPDNPVIQTGRYVMQLPRSIRSIDGNIMDTDFISEFYIGSDFVPPEVLSSDPPFTLGASDGIAVNSNIVINFSKSMDRQSVEQAFSITPDVSGYFIWSERVPGLVNSRLTFSLTDEMSYGKLYTFTVSGSALDASGNSLGLEYRVNFITGDDFTPPKVDGVYDASIVPGSDQDYWNTSLVNYGISKNVKIAVRFSIAMNRTSVENAFSITPSAHGNFDWPDDTTVIFTPSDLLEPETLYQLCIDTAAKNINGLKIASVFTAEFMTDSKDSLYVKCGNIWGSSDGVFGDVPLSAGIPSFLNWPLIIVMDQVSPYSQDYYIKLQFVSSVTEYQPVGMNKYSVINNSRIETYRSGPGGVEVRTASIVDITWIDDSTVVFKLSPLTNKKIVDEDDVNQAPALYRLIITGGDNGIIDKNGNKAQHDIIFDFREAI